MPRVFQPTDIAPRLYRAATGEEEWSTIVADIAASCGGSSGLLYDCDAGSGSAALLGQHNLDPQAIAAYESHYNRVDIWHQRAQMLPAGRVIGTDSLIGDAELLRSEFYCDHLRPQDLFYGAGATILRRPRRVVLFGIQRGRRPGAFTATELRALQSLMPHIRRSLAIARRLNRVPGLRDHVAALLAHSSSPAMLVDAQLRLHYANDATAQLFATGGGLRLRDGGIAALREADTRKLRQAVRRAMGMVDGNGLGDMLWLTRQDRPPLQVAVVPLSGQAGAGGRAMLLVNAPEEDGLAALARHYRLTPAEARLLGGLAAGQDLAAFAARQEVSVNTLRIHLRRLFAKTGTHRQAQLIQLAYAQDAGPGAAPGAAGDSVQGAGIGARPTPGTRRKTPS